MAMKQQVQTCLVAIGLLVPATLIVLFSWSPHNAKQPSFTVNRKGKLFQYVGSQFADIRAKSGKAEAKERIEAFLRTQKCVKGFLFHSDDEALSVTFEDGDSQEVLLYTFRSTDRPGR